MYSPKEDSFLLSDTLKIYLKNKNKEIKLLDMGSGSGIQAETCRKLGFKNITVVDIDKESIQHLKKQKFKTIKSNLFENIKDKFEIIIFNPPYLPEHKYDKKSDTTGGKKGYELIIKFLKQAKKHLEKSGSILLLYSSFSHPKIIQNQAKSLGYKINLLSTKKLFFEELFVVELKGSA